MVWLLELAGLCQLVFPFALSRLPVRYEQRKIEFFVLSYVPNILRGNGLEFAILAFERPRGIAEVRFIETAEGLLAFDPNADMDMLKGLYREIETRFQHPDDANAFLHKILDSYSSTIEISEPQTVIVSEDGPSAELDKFEAHRRK